MTNLIHICMAFDDVLDLAEATFSQKLLKNTQSNIVHLQYSVAQGNRQARLVMWAKLALEWSSNLTL